MDMSTRLSNRATWAAGQPISMLMSQALAHPDLISLAAGFVDPATLPVESTRKALDRLFADVDNARSALQYGTTPGDSRLRELILQRFAEQDGINLGEVSLSVDDVVITAGSNQLLCLILETLLDPGDIVLCAAPTYLVFLGAVANLGCRAIGVATDAEGMIPVALESTLQQLETAGEAGRVKALYLVPYADNPRGITMSSSRSAEILEVTQRWSHGDWPIPILVDQAYRDLRYVGEDIPSMKSLDPRGDQVVVMGTFSKSFSPGIRVGWGILPRYLVEPICDQKGNIDFGSPNFNQQVVREVMELDLLGPHLENLCQQYEIKCKVMLDAADRYFADLEDVHWVEPSGGLYVWMTLPNGMATGPGSDLFRAASEEGVLYVAGEHCYPVEGESIQTNTMRLSFGVQPVDRIVAGMESLSRAVRQVMEQWNGISVPGAGETG